MKIRSFAILLGLLLFSFSNFGNLVVHANGCSWKGTWQASTGVTIIFHSESIFEVKGTYQPNNGEIEGFLDDRGRLKGGWAEGNKAPPQNAGEIELWFGTNCDTLQGNWRQGYDQHNMPWNSWSANRMGGPVGIVPVEEEAEKIVFGIFDGVARINGQNASQGSDVEVECGSDKASCTANVQTNEPAEIEVNLECQNRTVDLLQIAMMEDLDRLLMNKGPRESDFVDYHMVMTILHLLAASICAQPGVNASDVSGMQTGSDITIDFQSGLMEFDLINSSVRTTIKTPTAQVTPFVNGKVVVGYNSDTNESLVQVTRGGANVNVPGSENVVLSSGDQVSISSSGAGPVVPIGTQTSPQPPSQTPTTGNDVSDFDANNNCFIDNDEFFIIVNSWATGGISDGLFFSAVMVWVEELNICSASSSNLAPEKLGSNNFVLTTRIAFRNSMLFEAQNESIRRMEIEIFNLQGRQITSLHSNHSSLLWNLRRPNGKPVANGVYIYRVLVTNDNGELIGSDLRKMMILR